jgi:hypothetical protein
MQNAPHPAAIDHLLELYCAWREECAVVQSAYERFCAAPPSDRTLAYAAYRAALDREAAAAEMYSEQIARVSSRVDSRSRTVAAGSAGLPAIETGDDAHLAHDAAWRRR